MWEYWCLVINLHLDILPVVYLWLGKEGKNIGDQWWKSKEIVDILVWDFQMEKQVSAAAIDINGDGGYCMQALTGWWMWGQN